MAPPRSLCSPALHCPGKMRPRCDASGGGGRPFWARPHIVNHRTMEREAEEGPTEPSLLRVAVRGLHFRERQAGRLKTITSAPSLSTLADTNCQPSRWCCATMSVADRLASSCRAALGTSTMP